MSTYKKFIFYCFFYSRILNNIDGSENKAAMPNQDDRYARHMLFYESIGLNGKSIQENINAKKVAIIGAGGIGTWLSYNLSASGVLDIKIIDSDIDQKKFLNYYANLYC